MSIQLSIQYGRLAHRRQTRNSRAAHPERDEAADAQAPEYGMSQGVGSVKAVLLEEEPRLGFLSGARTQRSGG